MRQSYRRGRYPFRATSSLRLEPLEDRRLLTVIPIAPPPSLSVDPFDDVLASYELVQEIDELTHVYEINGQHVTLIIEPSHDESHDESHNFLGPAYAGPATADTGMSLSSHLSSQGIPLLHSLPDAPAKVFLDFDGNFEPSWGGNVNVVTPAYDIDGDPETFGEEERQRIIEVWQRVSEDFSPFNIDVTTEDPSASATTLNQVRGDSTRVRTFYFRHNFMVSDATRVTDLRVNLLRDDGAAVYLNGSEVVRDNLPANAAYDDLAEATTSGDDEDRYWTFEISPTDLLNGNNTIAVEVHQRNDTSSDVSFDLSLVGTVDGQSQTLVGKSSTWRYLDDGSDQGTGWRAASFNDSAWPTGEAQFGYGEDDQQTVLAVYTAGIPRVRTYYFRHEFEITDPSALSGAFLNLLRDDGAAVYLNGEEIRRDNLPSNARFDTFAQSSVNGNDEGRFLRSSVSPSRFVAGRNILAVEVHQHSDTSSDVAFDLELLATIDGVRSEIVSKGSSWRYLDDGSDQGVGWRATTFDDSAWSDGVAQFGYGDVEAGTSHIAIGTEDWFEGGAGGVAFVNAFDPDGRTVAFVFTNGAGNSAKNIAEAATHEAGHTFGLGHQSTFDPDTGERLESYNPGSADWAPHMGVGYSRPLTTWHDGPTGTIDNFQDDMSRIARTRNGFGYRVDDHGGTSSTATHLRTTSTPFSVAGIIERNNDVDAFSFSIDNPNGGISVSLAGAAVGTNLNAILEIRNSDGETVVEANPSNSYAAEIAAPLSAGDYTLFVRNNGEYGRVGQYTLTGEFDANDAEFELNEIQRIGPLGSLVARSERNLGKVNFLGDIDILSVPIGRHQQIAAIITPSDPTARMQAGWSGDAATLVTAGVGEPLVLPVASPVQDLATETVLDLRVSADKTVDYSVDFVFNAAVESVRNTADVGTEISAAAMNPFNSRLAAVGDSGDGSDATFTLVPTSATWRYLDDGSNQGNAWRGLNFDDRNWPTGRGQFGYGDGDETTVLNELNSNGDRIRTFYFRHEFNVVDVNSVESLLVNLIRDDGIAVYLNGTDVFRNNLSASARFNTFAEKVTNEDEAITRYLPANLLLNGVNVLAVEVHQESDTSSDVSLELSLQANVPMTEEVVMLEKGSIWRYLDNGTDQGTAWRATNYNDSAWPQGRAEFGYGDDDERTELNQNRNGSRVRTFYFRKELDLPDPSRFQSVLFDVRYDDGVAFYINGTEYGRDRLAPNATFDAWALQDKSNEDEFVSFAIPAEAFTVGENVIAVEVHQVSATSSDVSFDLQVRGIRKAADEDSYLFSIDDIGVGKPFGVYLSGATTDFRNEGVQVFDPNDNLVATATGTAVGDANLVADFIPVISGVYTIHLQSFSRDDYILVVTPDSRLESELDPPLASPLEIGTLALGYVGGKDPVDLYSVTVLANQEVTVLTQTPFGDSTAGFTNHLDPQIRIFDSGGMLVAADADSGYDGNALLQWIPSNSGEHTIEVSSEFGEGEYTIRVAMPGDADLNGQIDAVDWALWDQSKFTRETSWQQGDFNGDGSTDGSDFNIWSAHRFERAFKGVAGSVRMPQSTEGATEPAFDEIPGVAVNTSIDLRSRSRFAREQKARRNRYLEPLVPLADWVYANLDPDDF